MILKRPWHLAGLHRLLADSSGVPGERLLASRWPGLTASMCASIALVMARSAPWAARRTSQC